MTTITIERALLEQIIEKFAACGCEVCTLQSINAIRAELAAPATAPEQCWCDEQGLGEPGISCGDCPTRDYKAPATAPEPVAWMSPKRFYRTRAMALTNGEQLIEPLYLHPPATAPERKPMPILEVNARWEQSVLGITRLQYYQVVREVEAFHGITGGKT